MNKLMQTEKVIEKAVLGSYKHIEKKFVDAFLTPDAAPEQEQSARQEKE